MESGKVKLHFPGWQKTILVTSGTSLEEALERAEIQIRFPCGGKGICGKCRIKIKGKVSAPSPAEQKHLCHLEQGWRLACQTLIEGECRVQVHPLSLVSFPKILTSRISRTITTNPRIHKVHLSLPGPTLEDQVDDLSRVERSLGEQGISALASDLELIRKIPLFIRKADLRLTAVVSNGKLFEVEGGDTRGNSFGVAFDVGTTSIVGILVDLDTGQELAANGVLNPQISHGEDIVTRVSFVQSHPNGLKILQKEVIQAINQIIKSLSGKAKVKTDNIYEATFVGNTVMHHFLLGINPLNLAIYPYVPAIEKAVRLKASELGIAINQRGGLLIFPNVAAFVGGDTVGVILATSLFTRRDRKLRLAVDIGTNGEIILAQDGRIVCASSAAGPAFEGARISRGMRAEKGAIERVRLREGRVEVGVIAGGRPRGICGSGLVDAVSELFREKIIDSSGRILFPPVKKIWNRRVIKREGSSGFLLASENESAGRFPIILTQNDIRELQLGKGAIRAGIQILLGKLGLQAERVDEVLLAGAFGSDIDPRSAQNIGLLPALSGAKVRSVGNAASLGAIMALLSQESWQEAQEISRNVEYVELAALSNFQSALAEGMRIGV